MVLRYLIYFLRMILSFFCRVKLKEVQIIQNLLNKYELTSGQKINIGKTTLFFGNSISLLLKNAIKNLLGLPEITEYERYLGHPAMVGKNRGKLQGWKEKLLSQAGRKCY